MVFQYLRISGECHNSFAVSATMSVCSEDWMMELMCFGCHELSQFFCPPVPSSSTRRGLSLEISLPAALFEGGRGFSASASSNEAENSILRTIIPRGILPINRSYLSHHMTIK
ncbi:hypothetical protein POPTR_009G060901v4 [Populus trichocarpa]|uniref:Uncharacterized protein n=1 Tax=Populus trichocarpa TaxID=3694 RepID=A0ACC0SGV0_POPTR|nr:hypothetical protein POPTR_009G060901v4 [Populus trichocarpa]